MNEFTHLDLFTGIGGFSLAFERAGFRIIAHSEIDPYASQVLQKHWPKVPNLGDVRQVTKRSADTYGHPHVITGGFPCQDISVAHNCGGEGKYDRATKGLDGARSGLWWEFLRIIRELRPVFCLIENVPNLRTQGADRVLASLEAEGYAAEPFVVGCYLVGGKHKRDRVWIVAHDKSVGVEGLRSEGQQVTHTLAGSLLPIRNRDGQWEVEPDLRRTANGISGWMDRLRCCGNAVMPQVVYPFATAFHAALTALKSKK